MVKKNGSKKLPSGKKPTKSKKQSVPKKLVIKVPKINGRPTKMTTATLNKLLTAFAIGCTDDEAIIFAEICPQTLYNYQKKNKKFLEQKEHLKKNPILLARMTVFRELETNPQTATWFLTRKLKSEFSEKIETDLNEETKKLLEEDLKLSRQLAASLKPKAKK